MRKPIVAVSGGFDPLHVGHVRYIQAAAELGDVHVYLNTDEWLMRKKGFIFMPFKDRAEILWSMKSVVLVIPADDADDTVWRTLQQFKPSIFAKGGDRIEGSIPSVELEICSTLGIEVIYNAGGEKIESSSELVKRAREYQKLTPVVGEWAK